MMKRCLLLMAACLFLPGCMMPVASVMMLGFHAFNHIGTGKTLPSHALSSVVEQDCSLLRSLSGKSVCVPYEESGMIAAVDLLEDPAWISGDPLYEGQSIAARDLNPAPPRRPKVEIQMGSAKPRQMAEISRAAQWRRKIAEDPRATQSRDPVVEIPASMDAVPHGKRSAKSGAPHPGSPLKPHKTTRLADVSPPPNARMSATVEIVPANEIPGQTPDLVSVRKLPDEFEYSEEGGIAPADHPALFGPVLVEAVYYGGMAPDGVMRFGSWNVS